jgi:Pro-kumamolisin, activation domain/Bacterial Ig-like domain (group 1)/Bacterial Ig-like domain (group 3)/Cep192 domain 4
MKRESGFAPGKAIVAAMLAVTIVMLAAEARWLRPAGAVTASLSAPPIARIPGNVPPALKRATLVEKPGQAQTEANQAITVTIVLKRDDQAGFERYLREIYDPKSPLFHRWKSQTELADRFGPSRAEYDGVMSYLAAHGFMLLEGSTDRLTLTMRGTRAAADRAFDVTIRDYRIGKRTFHANDTNPAMPTDLAPKVEAILGMSDLARPHHTIAAISELMLALANQFRKIANGSPAPPPPPTPPSSPSPTATQTSSATATATATATPTATQSGTPSATATPFYNEDLAIDLGPVPEEYDDGCSWDSVCVLQLPSGTDTVALLEFDNYNQSDVASYLQFEGLPSSAINILSEVNVNGGVAPGPDQSEVLLDVDAVLSLAPGAPVIVFDGPFTGTGTSFQSIFNAMLSHGGIGIISNSWAYCEDETTQADVESIDMIFQQAAAAGITVFNGSGDTGSTCLDGSANTVSVPADSPNATAVGGTSLTSGPGNTYGTEKWWDDSLTTPPAGQGGYGISKFFPEPSYQQSLLPGEPGRSVPDVVSAVDPIVNGVSICWAAGGGCPNGKLYGGTSLAAPMWAAYIVWIDYQLGTDIGFINPNIYLMSGTTAFHDAASMGSTPEQVGLGSPNLSDLEIAYANAGQSRSMRSIKTAVASGPGTLGPVDPAQSLVSIWVPLPMLLSPFEMLAAPPYIPADGSTQAFVVVRLRDSYRHAISGKTVKLSASSGNVQISPATGVSTVNNGAVVFTITDDTPENVTFTATDQSDSITLNQSASVVYGVPPAAAGEISASVNSNPADGVTPDTITVILQDSKGNPTPGKLVSLSQGTGKSAISAPSPMVTDSNGQVQFAVTDLVTETVTYTATDVSDGNLPVPGSAAVDFTNGPGGCAQSQPGNLKGTVDPANGFLASTFASGFTVNSGNQGFSYNCFGAWGMAWDSSGYLYVTDWPTGNIYKFGPSGGTADAGHLFTTVKAPASGVAIDPAGNMFASEASVSGPNGDIVPVDLSTGAVGTAIASGIECLGSMALDPATPALFAIDFCNVGQGGSDNIWQITGIDGGSPATAVYAQVPSSNAENLQVTVAPDGTLYDLFCAGGVGCEIARVTTASPPVVSELTTASAAPITLFGSLGIIPGGMQPSGDAQFIVFPQPAQDGLGQGIQTIDLTGSAAVPAVQITTNFSAGLSNFAIGPDGCLYIAGGPTVSRITRTDGTCGFGPTIQPPTISLTPATVSPNPAQGSSQSFTAALHYTSTLSGVPVRLQVGGANPQSLQLVETDSTGQANFSYIGAHSGIDTVVAMANVGGTSLSSNLSQVTWTSGGTHVTFLTLNGSPTNAPLGQSINVKANLADASVNPAAPLSGQTVEFTLGTANCSASTDSSGNATCQITPTAPGIQTLSASFAGSGNYNASSDSKGFNAVVPGPTATPTPVVGKLKITPKKLNFGSVDVGSSRTKTVKIVNKGRITKKKTALPITIEMQSATPDAFMVTQDCNQELGPKSKGVKPGMCEVTVTFTPAAAQAYSGTLTIYDNLEPSESQQVPMKGKGRQPK